MENYILSVCSSLTKFCNIICLGDPRHDVCLLLDRYYHSLYDLNRVELTREKKGVYANDDVTYYLKIGISVVHHVCITEVSPLKPVVMSYHQSWVEHSGTFWNITHDRPIFITQTPSGDINSLLARKINQTASGRDFSN